MATLPDVLTGLIAGVALAALSFCHFLLTRTQLSGSGRVTKLVDRWRFGPGEPNLTDEELVGALRQLSHDPHQACSVASTDTAPCLTATKKKTWSGRLWSSPAPHVTAVAQATFLIGVVVGARLNALDLPITWSMGEPVLAGRVTQSMLPWVMLGGGVCVGFGTRMAGGCTMGHGLCGAARLQSGSLVSTAAFFLTGITLAALLS